MGSPNEAATEPGTGSGNATTTVVDPEPNPNPNRTSPLVTGPTFSTTDATQASAEASTASTASTAPTASTTAAAVEEDVDKTSRGAAVSKDEVEPEEPEEEHHEEVKLPATPPMTSLCSIQTQSKETTAISSTTVVGGGATIVTTAAAAAAAATTITTATTVTTTAAGAGSTQSIHSVDSIDTATEVTEVLAEAKCGVESEHGGVEASDHYCLRWMNHGSHVLSVFAQLLRDEALVDVTLAAEGRSLRAHKMVLSACSSFFRTLFVSHPERHPIIILKDTKFDELQSLLEFMYKGEVSVEYGQLGTLLKTAENLRVKGLADVTDVTANRHKPTIKSKERAGQDSDDEDNASPIVLERDPSHPGGRERGVADGERPLPGLHRLTAPFYPRAYSRSIHNSTLTSTHRRGHKNRHHHHHSSHPPTEDGSVNLLNDPQADSGNSGQDLSSRNRSRHHHHPWTHPSDQQQQQQHIQQQFNNHHANNDVVDKDDGVNATSAHNNAHPDGDHNHRFKSGSDPASASIHPHPSMMIHHVTSGRSQLDVATDGAATKAQDLRLPASGSTANPNPPHPHYRWPHPVDSDSSDDECDDDYPMESPSESRGRLRRRHRLPTNSIPAKAAKFATGRSASSAHLDPPQHHPMSLKKDTVDWEVASMASMVPGTSRSEAPEASRSPSFSESSSEYGRHADQDPGPGPGAPAPEAATKDFDPGTIDPSRRLKRRHLSAAHFDAPPVVRFRHLSADLGSFRAARPFEGAFESPLMSRHQDAAGPELSQNQLALLGAVGHLRSFINNSNDTISLRSPIQINQIGDPSERPFPCNFCGKAFKLRHHMKDHARVHTGERPFPCRLCGKTFSRSTILKAHEKTHLPKSQRFSFPDVVVPPATPSSPPTPTASSFA